MRCTQPPSAPAGPCSHEVCAATAAVGSAPLLGVTSASSLTQPGHVPVRPAALARVHSPIISPVRPAALTRVHSPIRQGNWC